MERITSAKKLFASLALVAIAGSNLSFPLGAFHATVASAQNTEQFTFNTAWEIRDFVNSLSGLTRIPDDSAPQSAAARFDDTTANKICELKGYTSVVSMTPDFYRSCSDNQIAYWDNSRNDFTLIPSCQHNSFIWTLTCARPAATPQAPVASAPVGYLDQGISNCQVIQGWSCDADDFNQANDVHLYDGPAEQGRILGSVRASNDRGAAVAAQCGNNPNHGYTFTVPESIKDGQEHQIYAYGINVGAGSNNTHLQGSPMTIRCDGPITPPTPQCRDGRDNDGDNRIDMADPGCSNPEDN